MKKVSNRSKLFDAAKEKVSRIPLLSRQATLPLLHFQEFDLQSFSQMSLTFPHPEISL